MRNTFKVYERLKREQQIDTLFRTGKAYSVFPIRCICLLTPRQQPTDSPVLTGFSVPKKKFRSSVARHRMRRLMVEAWRLNKSRIYPLVPPQSQLLLFLLFTDSKDTGMGTVQDALLKCQDWIIKHILPKTPHEPADPEQK